MSILRTPTGAAAALFGLALAAAAVAPAYGHDGSTHAGAAVDKGAPTTASDASKEVKLRDREMVTSKGEPVRFVTDVLADRIVAIDFVYTSCTTICPALSSVFSLVQEKLGDRAGTEVWLISISVDPVRDTPRRLTAYAGNFDAGEGWIWLTGEKAKVDSVLNGLGAYTADIEEHPPMLLIGDAERGVWRRLFGFPTPDDIVAHIDAVAAGRAASKTNVNLGE